MYGVGLEGYPWLHWDEQAPMGGWRNFIGVAVNLYRMIGGGRVGRGGGVVV